MNILLDLEPKEVFKYFQEISNIPRGSGNEKKISDYLVNFAKSHNLDVIQDQALNVIIKKSASRGYENAPTVIIQGHMDIVCEKNKDVIHDFEKDSLKLRVDGDYIYATGTTLGGDDGIAIAYGLALLDSEDIKHPAIEFLATTEEETGMGGAMTLDTNNLKGKVLLNLDSEEEGKLLVSCAGGIRSKISLKIKWEESLESLKALEIKIKGLKGGHSGMEIHKQRGNANKLMGRVLNDLLKKFDFKISSINGGAKDNAIPREMDVVILVKKDFIEECKNNIKKWNSILQNELKTVDSDVEITLDEINSSPEKIFSKETTEKVIDALELIPSGVNTMSSDIDGLVESSTNLGVVKTTKNSVEYYSATRSSIGSLKNDIVCKLEVISRLLGGYCVNSANYPEWQYDKDSKIRTLCEETYKEITGNDAEIVALHAGLECGLFKKKLKDVDMISFGPNLYDVHTPNEHMSISSVKKQWDFLIKVLEKIK